MSRKKMLITIAAVALGIAGAVSSAQAGDNQSVTAAHAVTKDTGVKGRSQSFTGPLNPALWDDFEGYPHPK